MKHSLFGKNILITGSSRGIGKEIALTLAKSGANLILAARHELELEDVALNCEKLGVTAYSYKTDITDLDQVNNLFEFALERLGRIDIWIHNAVIGVPGEFLRTPMDLHEKVIKTNLLGFMNSAYLILPYFRNQGKGTLINNISLGSYVSHAASYVAARAGLNSFTEVLRDELKDQRDIFICDVCPELKHGIPINHYDPQKVSEAVFELCKNPRNKLVIESSHRVARVFDQLIEKVTEVYLNGIKTTRREIESRGWRNFHPLRLFFRH